MRKVLLIGNGFDLAQGAPTSFLDFSNHLITNILIPDLENYLLNDDFSCYFNPTILKESSKHEFTEVNKNWNLLGVLEQNNDRKLKLICKNLEKITAHLSNNFLKILYEERQKYWFDIEHSFYRHLKSIYNQKMLNSRNYDYSYALDKLNYDFKEIKNLLKDYLKSIEIPRCEMISQFFFSLKDGKDFLNGDLVILNFNYTDSIKKYKLEGKAIHFYFPIHGSIETDIIFGYGNDKDVAYKKIKNANDDRFLENFKTHQYLHNSVYQEVYNTLVKGNQDYEVHILGHSLGITDKTLLNEIFSSDLCKKIFIYKRKDKFDHELPEEKQVFVKKEYTKLTMAASRIIDDEMVRNKIVNYSNSVYFPLKNEI